MYIKKPDGTMHGPVINEPGLETYDPVERIAVGTWEATRDFAKLAWSVSPLRSMIDHGGWTRSIEGIASGLRHAAANPDEFAKAVIDYDTWRDDPFRAVGHLVPDLIAAIATGGSGAAATKLDDLAGAATKLDDLATAAASKLEGGAAVAAKAEGGVPAGRAGQEAGRAAEPGGSLDASRPAEGVARQLARPSLKEEAARAGVADEIDGPYEVFAHGTRSSVANDIVETQGGALSGGGGKFAGSFHTVPDAEVARVFADRSASQVAGEAPALVGVALPQDVANSLRQQGLLHREPIPNPPAGVSSGAQQWVFEPGAIDALKRDGFFFEIPKR